MNTKDIQWVIGHSFVVYLKDFLLVAFFLAILCVSYRFLNDKFPAEHWRWIFGFLGLGLFVKWFIDFLNNYLDCLILTKDSIILFLREGLLEYRTEIFFWNKITTLSREQNSVWDKIFIKGDLLIKLEYDTLFPFADVSNPKKQLGKLTLMKEQFLTHQNKVIEKDLSSDNEKFTILVDAMSEVVKEYMEKQTKK